MNPSMHEGWFFPFGGLFFILLAALLIAATVYFSRRATHERGPREARAILDRCLASGELSEAEYAHLREVLSR